MSDKNKGIFKYRISFLGIFWSDSNPFISYQGSNPDPAKMSPDPQPWLHSKRIH